jgi:hypothetical protein
MGKKVSKLSYRLIVLAVFCAFGVKTDEAKWTM